MIDCNELDRYYTGTLIHVISNAGGILLELGEDIKTVFYKIDDNHYVDINNKCIAQVVNKESVVTSKYIVPEESLVQVKTKKEINNNSYLIKRLLFDSSKYL